MQRISTCALVLAWETWLVAGAPRGAAAAPPAAAPAPANAADASTVVRPEVGKLKNGLRVLTLTDPQAAVATFQVWYDTGARDEKPGMTGISQLVEALMFQGTKTVGPDEFVRQVQAAGGVADGQTSNDYTAYWEALPADQLELAVRLEADRMANLALTPAGLEAARAAVQRQRRQDVESSPLGRGLELLDSLTFAGRPGTWPVTGAPADLAALTLAQCRDWYATRYTPDKAIVVIAGPATHEANLRLVERWFGKLKPGKPAPAPAAGESAQDGPRQGTVTTYDAQFPLLLVGYRTPPEASADGPVMDVIARLLAGGSASRLNGAVVDGNRSAFFAGATNTGRKDEGLFYALAGLRAGSDRDSLAGALTATIERLADAPLSDDDLARAQAQLETQYWFGLDQVQDRASAVAAATLVDGDPQALARRIERWRAVKKDDVARVARAWLNASNRVSVWVVAPTRSGS